MFKWYPILLAVLLLTECLIAPGVARGEPSGPVTPEMAAPLMQTVPVIDGRIDEAEWAQSVRIEGLCAKKDELDPRHATAWLGCDGKRIYIAVRSELPPSGILRRVKPSATQDQALVTKDDSLELWIDPHRGQTTGDRRYFQIITNADGALYDVAHDPANTQQPVQGGWRVDWQFRSQVHDNMWEAEIAIPFQSIGTTAEDLSHPWGFRIVRNWKQPNVQADVAPRNTAFDDRASMPTVRWLQDGPLVRVVSLRGPQYRGVDLAVELMNHSKAAQSVKLAVDHQSAQNPRRTPKEDYTLAPGEKKLFRLEEQDLSGAANTSILVTSGDGQATYFRRAFTWQIERPARLWLDQEGQAQSMLEFAYYPYFNRLKARLDISGLATRQRVTGATLNVMQKNSGRTIQTASFPAFRDGSSEIIMPLPPLESGTCTVAAILQGGEGVPVEPISREFQREVFEWEHNTLGISDDVIPPFTPLAVKDKVVSAVLREHLFNDLGLLDQVTSEGIDLLAGPMRIEAVVAGQPQVLRLDEPLRFTETRPNQVTAKSRWRAGPIRGSIEATMEMDGMMKVTLGLEEEGAAPVQKLDLVIPLRNEIVTLMHVVADNALRNSYAGAVPAGTGTIWESKQANRAALPGTFAPYIWLGNERQGVAWFADTDRDWLIDDAVSAQEIVRQGDQIALRVHLVCKPAPLGRQRTIVFGLQATPTKPLPTSPAPWRQWVFRPEPFKADEGFYRLQILGSCFYWGAYTACGDVYPRDRDLSIYELFRQTRQSAKIDTAAVAQWLAGYKGVTDEYQLSYKRHIENAVRGLQLQPQAVIPYTNARGTAFNSEFTTFQDEWLINAYTSRQWPTDDKRRCIAYDCSPVKSYQDFCLWYFAKMLDSGAMDGLYFDDVFLRANFDLVSGGAYVADDGSLRPSCDLFAMREYMKRSQTLVYQKRKAWFNIAHMTNTQMVPITTWAGVNLDWEWKYGMDDYQDRYSRDLTRTETIGLQSGCVPVVLSGIRGQATPERKAFVERTELAVTLVHEVKVWSISPIAGKVLRWFNDFGYGKNDCRVYRYWDKPAAGRLKGLDAEILVLVRNGKALVFAASYGDSGTSELILSGQQLGLKSGGSFTDLEAKQTLEKTGDFSARLQLPRHDFKVVVYE